MPGCVTPSRSREIQNRWPHPMYATHCAQTAAPFFVGVSFGNLTSRCVKRVVSGVSATPAALGVACSDLQRRLLRKLPQQRTLGRSQSNQTEAANGPWRYENASNKPQEVLINQQTYKFLLAHTAESQALAKLREKTAAQYANAKQMQVSPDQGRYLSWLAGCLGAKHAIEVGVFTGYSAICLAQALQPDGYLLACESDMRPLDLAQQAFAEAGVAHKINLQTGKAMDTLQVLLDNSYHDHFDMAFVDADKRGYWQYHEKLLKLVRRGGVLVYDNMFWYGAVANPEDVRKSTLALRKFNEQLLKDPRVDVCLVPIGDGMALCRRL